MPLPAVLTALVPPNPKARRLSLQSLLYATADGTFVTGSAVYFTQIIGLSAAQVGLGLTLGLVAAFVVAYPCGLAVDRFGAQRTWALGTLGIAVTFLLWPFVEGFGSYVALAVFFSLSQALQQASWNAYSLGILSTAERVMTQAFLYSAVNVGFTLGAIIGGITLAFDSLTLLHWMPLFACAVALVNAFFTTRMHYPILEPELAESPVPSLLHERDAGAQASAARRDGPLRNLGWMSTNFCLGILEGHQVLLHVVIPLWLVTETDSPHWLLAWLFGTNTVLCIFFPSLVAKGVSSIEDALRRARWATLFFTLSCAITWTTHNTVGFVTALLVWLGHVAVTAAELAMSSARWEVNAKLMDPRRRGEYSGVGDLFGTLGSCWAPALFTWLAMEWGVSGWVVIAGIFAAAAAGLHPSSRLARRFAKQHFPHAAIGAE